MFNDWITTELSRVLGPVAYVALVFILFLGYPLVLALVGLLLIVKGWRKPQWGSALGFGFGLWGSVCWLVIPYCGAYPNLPWLVLSLVIFDENPNVQTWSNELFIHAMNLTVYPLLGWLAFHAGRVISRWK